MDGAISLEGTFAGVAGSLLIALGYYLNKPIFGDALPIFVGGILGCLVDSALGATLQRGGTLNNHSVNFFSTLVAAILVGAYLLL